MKTMDFLVSCMGVVASGGLAACSSNAPAFMEMALSDTEYATNAMESDSHAANTNVAVAAKSALPVTTSAMDTLVQEQISQNNSISPLSSSDSSIGESTSAETPSNADGGGTGIDSGTGAGTGAGTGTAEPNTPAAEAPPNPAPTLPADTDTALAICLNGWPIEVASFSQTYSVVNADNKNNRIVFSDKTSGEIAHRIDLSTKNTNLGILELKNPQAAYCVHHDGWNANNITVRIACSARLIELDANLNVAHNFTIERIGCQ